VCKMLTVVLVFGGLHRAIISIAAPP
jgi:hypothetical protein